MSGQQIASRLNAQLQIKVPNAKLVWQTLPQAPEIQLALIDQTYPQADLSAEQVEELMDSPPYWAFCWASGQVMARYLLDQSDSLQGATVIDFGCGSGVVAIAAALAGAARVVAVDIDKAALLATQYNALKNQVMVELTSDLEQINIVNQRTVLVVADVFYDADNIVLLKSFIERYDEVIVADSRVKLDLLQGVQQMAHYVSCTVPDLGESNDFNSVRVYRTAIN